MNTQEESLEEVVTDGVTTEAVQSDAEVSLESLLAERDGLVDQLQRSVAEFQNYRRRVDQERFRNLLKCEDPDLFSWFMGYSQPENADHARMVRMILDRVQPK